nr:type III secretion protein [uncultured Pseudomonas sp.]
MKSPAAEDLWVRWWCNPWDWAHPAWQERFASSAGASIDACDALMVSRHGAFVQSVGIDPSQPPIIAESVLRWLTLTSSQRDRALALAQQICFTQTERDGADGRWCWAVTRGLRPGAWLKSQSHDARLVLGAWLGPPYWSRLRLAWPPDEVAESPVQAPENKLQTLWQAVLWRVMST